MLSQREQYALLSLPSSGSDWLAETIAAVNPELKYYRQFFTPAQNYPFDVELSMAFGDEMFDTVHLIACVDASAQESAYQQSWARCDYNFVKEVYTPWSTKVFFDHFKCFMLERDWKDTFPPNRLRVIVWYNAIFESLVFAHSAGTLCKVQEAMMDWCMAQSLSRHARIVAAHFIANYVYREAAKAAGMPTPIQYSALMEGDRDAVEEHLSQRLPPELRPTNVAARLCETRKVAPRDQSRLNEWTDCQAVVDKLSEIASAQ